MIYWMIAGLLCLVFIVFVYSAFVLSGRRDDEEMEAWKNYEKSNICKPYIKQTNKKRRMEMFDQIDLPLVGEKRNILRLGTAVLTCPNCNLPLSERDGETFCRNMECVSFCVSPLRNSVFGGSDHKTLIENYKSLKGVK